MSIDTAAPRTRRAVIVGVVGGLVATVAGLARAPLTRAGVDGDLVLEATNNTDAQTELLADTSAAGLRVVGTGIGLQGWGDIGVDAYGETIGVNAIGDGTGAPAGVAWNRANSVGQFGMSTDGSESPPTMPSKTGVFGLAEQDSDARGVFGKSTAGQGVRGESTSGIGVEAIATTGVALDVSGRAQFSRSGRASIPANARNVDVTVPGGLGPNANVLATLQIKRGSVQVIAARPNYPSAGKVRIYISDVASTTAPTPVAWFVLG
jgi:hypothetical protein